MARSDRKTEVQLKQLVSNAISAADDQGERTKSHRKALDYYWGRMPANKPGRSQVVSTDLADMTEAVMAQLMPSFTNDQLGTFEALSEEDVAQADEESVACNHVVMELNDGFIMFATAIKDAMLKRNAVVRVEIESKTDVATKRYDGVTAIELQELLKPVEARSGVMVEKEPMDVELVDDELTSLTIKTTTKKQTLRVRSVDPSRFIIDADYDEFDTQDSPLTGEVQYMTRSELIERGFSKTKVNRIHAATMGEEDGMSASGVSRMHQSSDSASELIQVYRVFMRVDADGDGVAELREFWLAGGLSAGELLMNEPAEYVPYALGTAFIMPHTWEGVSLYDKLKAVQETKTQGLRQWVDNTVVANYGRYGVVEDQVNYTDVMNAVPGGMVRMSSPNAIVPLPTIDVGPSAAMLLGYMDKMRTEKGGASLDMQGAETQIVGDTAAGIDRQFTSKEQLCELMAQTLAETVIKQTFLLVHRVLRTEATVPLILKRGDEWLTQNPQEWGERERVNVTLGASLTQRNFIMMNLEKMIGFAIRLKEVGIGTTLMDAQGIFRALKDWGYSANLNNPENYWIDPQSKKGQQMAKNAQAGHEQQQQAMAQMNIAAMQVQQQIETMKEHGEMTRHVVDTQLNYFKEWLKAEIEEAKLVGTATLDLERAQQAAQIATTAAGDV